MNIWYLKKKSQILAFGAIKFAHGLFLRKAFSSLLPDFFYSFNALFFHAFPVFLHTQLLWYLLMESGDGGSLSPRSSMAARVRRDWSFPASESAEGDRDRTVQRGCEATRGRDTRVCRATEGGGTARAWSSLPHCEDDWAPVFLMLVLQCNDFITFPFCNIS